jgi:hypothetical protein
VIFGVNRFYVAHWYRIFGRPRLGLNDRTSVQVTSPAGFDRIRGLRHLDLIVLDAHEIPLDWWGHLAHHELDSIDYRSKEADARHPSATSGLLRNLL